MTDDLGPDEELIIAGLLERYTARELAEELVRRCGCTFDHRLPDNAPPFLECSYHSELRAEIERLKAENLRWQGEHTALKLDYQNVEAALIALREQNHRLIKEREQRRLGPVLQHDKGGDA